MDTIILAASLVSFFALICSWLAMPASSETAPVMAHAASARA